MLYDEEHSSHSRMHHPVEFLDTGIENMGRLDEFINLPNRSPQLIEVEYNLHLLTDSKEIS
jgi:hypothetical protein